MEEAKELIINPTIQLIFLGIVSLAGTGISAGVLYIVKTLKKQGQSVTALHVCIQERIRGKYGRKD